MKKRVIQWSTGGVGREALRAVIRHPELELVGVWAHSPAKQGVDAGDLCGEPTTGVVATGDADALLRLEADCVLYASTDVMRMEEVIEDYRKILRSGKNVVGSTITSLVHPASTAWHEELDKESRAAGVSFLVTGEHPGLFLDALPVLLSNGMIGVEQITLTEMCDISICEDPRVFTAFGFGMTPEQDAENYTADFIPYFWQSTPALIAEGLGGTVDRLETFREVGFSGETFDVPAVHVEKGTVSSMYCGFTAVIDGAPRVRLEEVFWIGPPQIPAHWPQIPPGGVGHRVVLEGTPRIQIDMTLGEAGSNPLTDAYQATGARAANLIPALCDAAPGVYNSYSLAATAGFWSGAGS